jgi:hypothetical protein
MFQLINEGTFYVSAILIIYFFFDFILRVYKLSYLEKWVSAKAIVHECRVINTKYFWGKKRRKMLFFASFYLDGKKYGASTISILYKVNSPGPFGYRGLVPGSEVDVFYCPQSPIKNTLTGYKDESHINFKIISLICILNIASLIIGLAEGIA